MEGREARFIEEALKSQTNSCNDSSGSEEDYLEEAGRHFVSPSDLAGSMGSNDMVESLTNSS